MSMAEYLESCRGDPMRYANAAERLLAAIGEPQMIDTAKDPRLGRIFLNRTMRAYPAFAGFHGMEETIERIVGFFRHAAQGLEERNQILYLLGPVGGGKSSLAERLKSLMEVHPIYVLKVGDEIGPRNLLPAVFVVLQRGDVGSERVWCQSPEHPIRVRTSNAPVCRQSDGGSQDLDTIVYDRGLAPVLLFWWRKRTYGGFPNIRHTCIQINERPYSSRYPSSSACHGNASEAVSHQDDILEFFGFDGIHNVIDEDIDMRGNMGEMTTVTQSRLGHGNDPMLLLGELCRDTRAVLRTPPHCAPPITR
jgi:PrkA AAA domain